MKRKLLKFLAFCCCFVLLILLGAAWYTHPGRGRRMTVDPREKGYVEEVDGTVVLHLKGSPYEMGYQHGALMGGKITKAMDGFNRLLDLAEEEMGIPRFVSEFLLDCVYRRCSRYIPDRYKREMEGIADGAGVNLQTVRRAHVVSVVTERGCSAFAVFGKATVGGKLYHGRNFDWTMGAGIQDNAALILYEPDGMVPFASAGYIGSIGVLSGMNMEGISISQIGAVTKDKRFSGIPLFFLLRRILEESHSLTEATEIVRNAHRTVGYNYVVADGDAGEARAYETTAHHCAIFTDNDPKETVEYAIPIDDAVFRADGAIDQTVRSFQTCARGYPNMPYGSNSYDHRYKGMATRIKEHHGRIDERVALDILKAVAMRSNLHGVLCNSTDREMWVAHAVGPEGANKQPYVYYDLKQIFLPPEQRTAH